MNWICSQIGAREHYSIPRVLHRAGKLERLYTDLWATAPWRVFGKLAGKSRLATRYHSALEGAPISAFNFQALKASRQRFSDPYEGFLQVGKAFGKKVVQHLQSSNSQLPASSSTVFFGYDTGFLEPARWIKARGGKAIVCQMDPARYEVDLVKAEERKWPGWARRSVEVPESYFQRREAEWAAADLIMVNSEWSRQALIKQGVPGSKLAVVPLAFETSQNEGLAMRQEGFNSSFRSQVLSFTKEKPLRVLFLGQVILRKGIQYLIEAARLLEKEPIHFDVVGSIGISDAAVASAPGTMTFHGPVSRDRTEVFYREVDLFVLPTLSDGFAMTQLEAMAHRLPVIATPNCGEVVSDGVDGLMVPATDSNALAEAFQLLLQDPEKLQAMREATMAKLEQFSMTRLGEDLAKLENQLLTT